MTDNQLDAIISVYDVRHVKTLDNDRRKRLLNRMIKDKVPGARVIEAELNRALQMEMYFCAMLEKLKRAAVNQQASSSPPHPNTPSYSTPQSV